MSEGAHRRTNSTPAVSRADSSEAPSACTSTFLNLRKRLATEERPAGLPSVVVAFVVGEEQWVIDLRDGLTAEQAVRRGEAESPDVACKLSPADFAALLEGRLSAFKAYTSGRLVVVGEMRLLRSLGWLLEAPTDSSTSPQEQNSVRVRVTDAKASGDHGVYRVVVEDGAACWMVWRRWRELKELTATLAADYGRGTPFNLPLPSLPRSVMRSTSARLLRQRQQQMEAHLNCLLTLVTCSPRVGTGPAALLHFLGSSAHGNLSQPMPSDVEPSFDKGAPTFDKAEVHRHYLSAPSAVLQSLQGALLATLPLFRLRDHEGTPPYDKAAADDAVGGAALQETLAAEAAAGGGGGSDGGGGGGGRTDEEQPAACGGTPIRELRVQLQIDLQAARLDALAERVHLALALGALAVVLAALAIAAPRRAAAASVGSHAGAALAASVGVTGAATHRWRW